MVSKMALYILKAFSLTLSWMGRSVIPEVRRVHSCSCDQDMDACTKIHPPRSGARLTCWKELSLTLPMQCLTFPAPPRHNLPITSNRASKFSLRTSFHLPANFFRPSAIPLAWFSYSPSKRVRVLALDPRSLSKVGPWRRWQAGLPSPKRLLSTISSLRLTGPHHRLRTVP